MRKFSKFDPGQKLDNASVPRPPMLSQTCHFQTNVMRSRMSAMGQKQTLAKVRPMSGLPPKADIDRGCWDVRFVPIVDIADLSAAQKVACPDGVCGSDPRS
jgi:hypothetical protein